MLQSMSSKLYIFLGQRVRAPRLCLTQLQVWDVAQAKVTSCISTGHNVFKCLQLDGKTPPHLIALHITYYLGQHWRLPEV